MQRLLQTGLLLHMIGIATVAGVTFAGYIVSRQFRIQYAEDKQKGLIIVKTTSKLSTIAGMGLLLQIVSGMMMLTATDGAFVNQLWFKIKMFVVISIITGMVLLKRVFERRLLRYVASDIAQGDRVKQIGITAGRVSYLQLLLLAFFIAIFILSVFRFI